MGKGAAPEMLMQQAVAHIKKADGSPSSLLLNNNNNSEQTDNNEPKINGTQDNKLQQLQEMLFSNDDVPLFKSSNDSSSVESVSIRVSDSSSDHSAPDLASPHRNRVIRPHNRQNQQA